MNYCMNKGIEFSISIRGTVFNLLCVSILFIGCDGNNNYGLYTVFLSYCNSTLNPDEIELRLISDTDYGTPLQFSKMDVSTKPLHATDSIIICQYNTNDFNEIVGKSSFLMFKYKTSNWITIDSQYIMEEKIISKDIFIGRKSIAESVSMDNYQFYEYYFDGFVDTIFTFNH